MQRAHDEARSVQEGSVNRLRVAQEQVLTMGQEGAVAMYGKIRSSLWEVWKRVARATEEYMEEFRLNGDVLKAITWLRDGMPRNPEGPGHIPPPPPYIIPADKDEIDEDDDELQEQLAIEEDIRLAEEKIRIEQEEIEAAKRAAKKAEEDRKKKELEELQAKKEAKWLEEMKAEADKASRP